MDSRGLQGGSQDLWCGDEITSSKLLWVFHSEEEVEMADHYTQQHRHPTAERGEIGERGKRERERERGGGGGGGEREGEGRGRVRGEGG